MTKMRRLGLTAGQVAVVFAGLFAEADRRRRAAPVVLVPVVPGDGSAPFSVPV